MPPPSDHGSPGGKARRSFRDFFNLTKHRSRRRSKSPALNEGRIETTSLRKGEATESSPAPLRVIPSSSYPPNPGEESHIGPPNSSKHHHADGSSRHDLWSGAYKEAVQSSEDKVKRLAVTGVRLDDLFKRLEEENDRRNESIFNRGLKVLSQPLQYLKLSLDIAGPFVDLEPTKALATATNVVKSVTTVHIRPSVLNTISQ